MSKNPIIVLRLIDRRPRGSIYNALLIERKLAPGVDGPLFIVRTLWHNCVEIESQSVLVGKYDVWGSRVVINIDGMTYGLKDSLRMRIDNSGWDPVLIYIRDNLVMDIDWPTVEGHVEKDIDLRYL